MINKERMELFAAALESGNYEQCKGVLRQQGRYWANGELVTRHCALGVMTQVALDNGLAEELWSIAYSQNWKTPEALAFSNGNILHDSVADWYGLPSPVPPETWKFTERHNPVIGLDDEGVPESMAGFNDAGVPFWDIAQKVRAKWLKDEAA